MSDVQCVCGGVAAGRKAYTCRNIWKQDLKMAINYTENTDPFSAPVHHVLVYTCKMLDNMDPEWGVGLFKCFLFHLFSHSKVFIENLWRPSWFDMLVKHGFFFPSSIYVHAGNHLHKLTIKQNEEHLKTHVKSTNKML